MVEVCDARPPVCVDKFKARKKDGSVVDVKIVRREKKEKKPARTLDEEIECPFCRKNHDVLARDLKKGYQRFFVCPEIHYTYYPWSKPSKKWIDDSVVKKSGSKRASKPPVVEILDEDKRVMDNADLVFLKALREIAGD